MKEISSHILDIVQSSIRSGTSLIQIIIVEDKVQNRFEIKIIDNGCGIDQEIINQINNPSFINENKETGFEILLLKQHAEIAGGWVKIESEKGKGTSVIALFEHNHILRQPMGDIAETITRLIGTFPNIDFVYRHTYNNKHFTIDTREIITVLEGVSISNVEIISFLNDMIKENLEEITN
jgi:hypothetical protein